MKLTLRAARVNAGLTQTQVSERTPWSRYTIADWENGVRHPARYKLEILCKLYGINVEDLKEEAKE